MALNVSACLLFFVQDCLCLPEFFRGWNANERRVRIELPDDGINFRCAAARSKRAIRHTNKTSTRLKVSSIVVIRLALNSMCGNRHRNLSRHGYRLTQLSRPIAECLA